MDNIRDQVDSCFLMFQFNAFGLKSKEDLNGCSQKISALYNTFGVNAEHAINYIQEKVKLFFWRIAKQIWQSFSCDQWNGKNIAFISWKFGPQKSDGIMARVR